MAANCQHLWRSDDAKLWDAFRRSYAAALAAAAAGAPGKKGLVALDKWWRHELAPTIKGRPLALMTLAELSRVMKWKLTRGKMRPLQKLIDSNSEEDVQRLSSQAFDVVSASASRAAPV